MVELPAIFDVQQVGLEPSLVTATEILHQQGGHRLYRLACGERSFVLKWFASPEQATEVRSYALHHHPGCADVVAYPRAWPPFVGGTVRHIAPLRAQKGAPSPVARLWTGGTQRGTIQRPCSPRQDAGPIWPRWPWGAAALAMASQDTKGTGSCPGRGVTPASVRLSKRRGGKDVSSSALARPTNGWSSSEVARPSCANVLAMKATTKDGRLRAMTLLLLSVGQPERRSRRTAARPRSSPHSSMASALDA
jgi:hypothetical protein